MALPATYMDSPVLPERKQRCYVDVLRSDSKYFRLCRTNRSGNFIQTDDQFDSAECRYQEAAADLPFLGLPPLNPRLFCPAQHSPPYFLLNREALQNCVQDISTEGTSFLLCCVPNLFSFGRLTTYQQGRPCILRVRHR